MTLVALYEPLFLDKISRKETINLVKNGISSIKSQKFLMNLIVTLVELHRCMSFTCSSWYYISPVLQHTYELWERHVSPWSYFGKSKYICKLCPKFVENWCVPPRLEFQILLRPRSKIKTKHLEVNLSGLVEASMSRFKNNPIIK